jgi:CHAD domain-containing protein
LKIWADAAREPRMSTIGKAGSVDVVVALVQGEWDALSARVAVLTPDSTIEDFHQIRILAKKVRYAAAAVRPILDEPVQAWADEAARMQEILGAHQDAFVAEGTLNRLSADLALGPDVVAAVKQLTAALAADRARIRSDFLRAYGEPPTGDAGRGGAC